MARFLYDFFIQVLQLAFWLAAPVHRKARQWVAGRRNWYQSLERQFAGQTGPVVWFHCASLGEFEQGRPVLEAFRREFPNWKILLTFFSPSGYTLRHDYEGADYVGYLPADTALNARRFVETVKPQLVFWVKYEFWYHHLNALHERGVPVVLFSAIFRADQLFFKSYGHFYRKMLFFFDQILVQNDASLQLLRGIGIPNAYLGGDTRFDRVAEIAAAPRHFPLVEQFKGKTQLLVVGSLWPDDWEVLKGMLNAECRMLNEKNKNTRPFSIQHSAFRILIAPHEINPAQIDRWQTEIEVPSVRYSQATPELVQAAKILWIDNVGMLASLYQYADYAFIGGAYGDGLHNTLEAAVYGVPIFFGNKVYHKFQEAHDLLALGCAFAVADAAELERIFSELRADETRRRQLADRAAAYVRDRLGATEQVMIWARLKVEN
ncbi:MAG: 3-deoxy-D-manno-octulosonic acid transferase [Cytophagaceae bacterium]|nr:3-deoxy-D-manno-octulosonic acid transferase [Cytophagaceae bacterium]